MAHFLPLILPSHFSLRKKGVEKVYFHSSLNMIFASMALPISSDRMEQRKIKVRPCLHGCLDGLYHLAPIWYRLPDSPHNIKHLLTSMYQLPKRMYNRQFGTNKPRYAGL